MIGIAVLLLTGVLTWDDIKSEAGAWDTLVWFSALVMMATYLNELGLMTWFGQKTEHLMQGVSPEMALIAIVVMYFYVHYLFASSTAHVAAMYAAFLSLGVALGVDGLMLALMLGFASNLYAITTHYGTGPAPILFGAGYVDLKDWWLLGFLMSIVLLVIWLGIGTAWFRIIGL
jgi:DASS family divalent anion:Na+ symporter